MTRDEIFNFFHANYHDYNKMKSLLENIIKDHQLEIKTLQDKLQVQTTSSKKELTITKETSIVESKKQESQSDIKDIINLFDVKRQSIQANFVRQEYRNMDGEYLLRKHLVETNRTPKMFLDAVQWLFSNNPKAAFHREYIMNIGSLIKHFNTIEHQAMYSEESVQYSEEAQVWVNVYKKKGFSDEEILQKLREGGYLQ